MRKMLGCALAVSFAIGLAPASAAAAEPADAQTTPAETHLMAAPGGYSMLTGTTSTVFPFELDGTRVIVPVSVNGGEPLRLILDTGMPAGGAALYETRAVKALDLASVGKVQLMGAGGGTPIEADVAAGVTLGLPGLELTNQMVVLIPEDAAGEHALLADGIIGYAVFGRFAVRLDYEHRTITLTEPSAFAYAGAGETLPIQIVNNMAFVGGTATLSSGVEVPVDLVLDTGASHALSLNPGSREGLVVPEKSIVAVLGRGLTAAVKGRVGRIAALRLGNLALRDVVTSFPTEKPHPIEKEGNLGGEVLRRFNVTFDYAHQRMFLEPNADFTQPFEYDMAGFQFERTEIGGLKIRDVIAGSPAAEAGLLPDDVVTEIDSEPVRDLDAGTVSRLLRQEGREVVLTVARGDEIVRLRLVLRRLV